VAAVRRGRPREIYIDAFRGLMALVMVQGHTFDSLLTPAAQAEALYRAEVMLHGSTAPGFLFASGFVAGLPRAPLSLRASLRRARRLIFVLGVGYALHLPYLSLWKTTHASAGEKAALFACDALQVIAASQLLVLVLQWMFGRRWTLATGILAVAVVAVGPWVWASGIAANFPRSLGAYLDQSTGSHFPVFPFATFVLAGTVAGAAIGRQEVAVRRKRSRLWGGGLVALGVALSAALAPWVAFWGVSPGYTLLRLGGLLLLLSFVEAGAQRGWRVIPPLGLLGHETLLVFVLHLYLLFGGVVDAAPLGALAGRLSFGMASVVTALMVPVLFAAAWLWHRAKVMAPHVAAMALAFLTTLFCYEFLTRAW
jgi:fucose 4-O-acetylase-like acetyltransferase